MSEAALQDFAKIAQQLAEALDQHKPTQGNQTLLVLADLSNELPSDNPLRLSIEQQMGKLAATEFSFSEADLNKTLIVLGTLKGRLKAEDPAQEKIDVLMAKVLSTKFDLVNGQNASSSSASGISSTASSVEADDEPAEAPAKPSISIPEPAPEPEPKPEPVEAPLTINIPEVPADEPATPAPAEPVAEAAAAEPVVEVPPPAAAEAAPAPAADPMADTIHKLQLSLDQLPVAIRQAFTELKAIEDNGGTVQAYVTHLKSQAADEAAADERVKTELERLSVLIAKIEDAPAEADQFQVLYDQVSDKDKDLKTGVFSIFQREYGGNARRFVVERTAQYAKYVPAEESRQRMIEDLHKLMEQAQKSLGQSDKAKAAPAADKNNRAFFHG